MAVTRIRLLRWYLVGLGGFTLFWWPLSHWFYADWYHHLLGFTTYDYSLVKIIGTMGFLPVLGMYFAARDPVRNRDFILSLAVFSLLLAVTFVFLIETHDFPAGEYVNVGLSAGNALTLLTLYPRHSVGNEPTVTSGSAFSDDRGGSPVL